MPVIVVRFIGLVEVLGAIGLILPAITRIQPILTAWAATGLAIAMAGAVILHVIRGEFGFIMPSLILFILSAFVAYGRFKLAPIAAKGQEKNPAPA